MATDLFQYVPSEQLPKLTLQINKPNREPIGFIKDRKSPRQTIKLGQINDLSFSVPYLVERNFMLVDNPIIKKIKSQYHIKLLFGNYEEWFVITNLQSTLDDNGVSFLSVQLKSLGHQLKKRKIRTWAGVLINGEYQKESLNAQQILQNLLSSSSWSIGYIDSYFLTKYRAFDFNNTTVLDAIFQVAETFGGIIQWDTVNKSISLLKQENVGVNKGFTVSERKLMKSLNKEEQGEDIVTTLRVYGKDNLSINRINPLGTDYLQDYSYYLFNFSRDEVTKETLSSSDYMSDSLCSALLDYNDLAKSKEGEFDSLLTQKEDLEAQLTPKENELSQLETDLELVLDLISVKQTQQLDVTAELQQKADLESQIVAKKSEIATLESQIDNVDNQISDLKTLLSMENNFTPEQIIELDDYTHIETWEDQNYTSDTELYEDGKKVFEELNKPKEIITTNIINVFRLQEAKSNWEKVVIGDKFYINYERFGIDIETQLIEMDIDHDSSTLNITIANTKDIERNTDKLSNLLYKSIGTTQTVEMNKYKYDQINNVKTSVDDILQGRWNPASNGISAGVNNSVEMGRRGITITSSDDPLKFIRMNNGVIGFTNDGGNTFKLSMDATGVYAETLVGKITITENLFIENITGKYSFDQFGFTIDGGSFKMMDDGNGISITPEGGFVATSDKVKSMFGKDGILFQVKEGSNWYDKLYFDVLNDRFVFNGEGNFLELKVQGQSVLTGDKTKINGGYIDYIKTDQLVAGYALITDAMIENITADKIVTGYLRGVTIDVDTDLRVGDNIYLGDPSDLTQKYLVFSNNSYIANVAGAEALEIYSTGQITLKGYSVNFRHYGSGTVNVDFSNTNVTNLYPTFG